MLSYVIISQAMEYLILGVGVKYGPIKVESLTSVSESVDFDKIWAVANKCSEVAAKGLKLI